MRTDDRLVPTTTKYGARRAGRRHYDGESAMAGCVNVVQIRIREKAQLAVYVHCTSHVLNLVLNTRNNVCEIRNMY